MFYDIEAKCLFSGDALVVAISAACTVAAGLVAIVALVLYLCKEARKVDGMVDDGEDW